MPFRWMFFVRLGFQERKKEVVSIQVQLEAQRAVFVQSEKESKRRETELAEQLAVVQAQLSEVRAAAARTKEDQLNTVLAGSHSVSACSRWGWASQQMGPFAEGKKCLQRR